MNKQQFRKAFRLQRIWAGFTADELASLTASGLDVPYVHDCERPESIAYCSRIIGDYLQMPHKTSRTRLGMHYPVRLPA